MNFIVSNDPSREFNTAEAALMAATRCVWLKPALFGTYVDRLNRGLAVTWTYGFRELSVRPVKAPWVEPRRSRSARSSTPPAPSRY